jgi:hypothetical protein
MKLSFQKSKRNFYISLGELHQARFMRFVDGFEDGTEMEVIVRKKMPWDTNRMRKYFEGPVCAFVKDKINERMIEQNTPTYTKISIREGLKALCLGTEERIGGQQIAISTTTLDHKGWVQFLKGIDDYCIETFQQGIPEAEE